MGEIYRKIEDIVDDEEVNQFTKLGEKRYEVKKFTVTEKVKSSFDSLSLDPYCGAGRGVVTNGKHRL